MKATILNNPVVRYFREAREELRKVTWPSRRDVLIYSGFVIAVCVIVAAYFGLLDFLLTKGLDALVKAFNK